MAPTVHPPHYFSPSASEKVLPQPGGLFWTDVTGCVCSMSDPSWTMVNGLHSNEGSRQDRMEKIQYNLWVLSGKDGFIVSFQPQTPFPEHINQVIFLFSTYYCSNPISYICASMHYWQVSFKRV